MVIRYATEADQPRMQQIFNQEVEYSTASWEWSPLSNQDWNDWFDAHTRDHHVLLVAEVDSEVAGFAGYGAFRTKAGYASTVEDSIFIEERHRGRGLGRRLLAQLVGEARLRGVHAMVAAVTGENTSSIRLHRALGFAEVGRLPEVGHKFGRWLDLVLLQIILDDRTAP